MKHASQNNKNLPSESTSIKMRRMREPRANIKIQKAGIINRSKKKTSARFHTPTTRSRVWITRARTWKSIWTRECQRVPILIRSLRSRNSKKYSKMKITRWSPMVINLFANTKHLLQMRMITRMKRYSLSHPKPIKMLIGLEEAYWSRMTIRLLWRSWSNQTNCYHNSKFKNRPSSRSSRLSYHQNITLKIFLILLKSSKKRQQMKITMNPISYTMVQTLTIQVIWIPNLKICALPSICNRTWLLEISRQDNWMLDYLKIWKNYRKIINTIQTILYLKTSQWVPGTKT